VEVQDTIDGEFYCFFHWPSISRLFNVRFQEGE
jgi:hypothetical protein